MIVLDILGMLGLLLIPWALLGALDGLTYGGLFKNKYWQNIRKILWNNG